VNKVKRCGHGFGRFEHYRLRVLLHAGGIKWPSRPSPPRIRTPRSPHDTRRATYGSIEAPRGAPAAVPVEPRCEPLPISWAAPDIDDYRSPSLSSFWSGSTADRSSRSALITQ
jgi:hypothetical protein